MDCYASAKCLNTATPAAPGLLLFGSGKDQVISYDHYLNSFIKSSIFIQLEKCDQILSENTFKYVPKMRIL